MNEEGYQLKLPLNLQTIIPADDSVRLLSQFVEAMGNGQLKPAFNLQHGADAEYITWLTVGPQPADTTTLIPFLKETEEYLAFKYKKIIADAGYENEENYE